MTGRARSASRARTTRVAACTVLLAFVVVGSAPAADTSAPAATAPSDAPLSIPPLQIDGPADSKIRLELFNRLRGEFVDWFAEPTAAPEQRSRYNFIGNKLQIGLRVTRDPWEMFLQFQDTSLGNVPSDAVGVGSVYYANTPESTQNGAFLRNGWLSTSQLFGVDGLFVKGGRQLYSNGMEVKLRDPNLAWIQSNRFSQRLIGPFDYTHVGRSFDGGQIGWNDPRINFTAFGFRPTWGGFEVNGMPELDIDIAGAALSLPDSVQLGSTFAQLVWIYYHDYRDVTYVDNRPLPVRQAAKGQSTTLHTIGSNAAHVEPLGPGSVDVAAYAFGQFGGYQELNHSAWAYGAEAGYRLSDVWARPWLRFGIDSASGDPNPDDDLHQTFFQMLPTAWLYAQFPFYNMMNNQDVFAQAILDPDPRVSLRFDAHWLRVNSSRDLAYFGGGATKNDFFGFGGVPADGRYELAWVTQGMVTLRLLPFFTVNAFYAHAFGQGVIGANFGGRHGNYGYLETILSF